MDQSKANFHCPHNQAKTQKPMTLICPQCQARLQLDDAKTPAQSFTVRCPKCQTAVKRQPSDSATEFGSAEPLPAGGFQIDRTLAPRFKLDREVSEPSGDCHTGTSGDVNDLVKLLAQALGRADGFASGLRARKMRKVLVCGALEYRESAARLLVERDCEVFVAENTQQALGRLREESMDVVLLDANFDPIEQGTAFVMREIKSLRPAQRRRVFLVFISSSTRTMDLHAAFLHNVNLVFNPSDLDQLPEALDASIRNYNELYRDYFLALNIAAI
jgi:predicted Zn finger-like uncharacterized protein